MAKVRFQPGKSGNPGGKPKSARNRLTRKFLYELAAHFETHGKTAIERVAEEDPTAYLKVCANLVPKEFSLEVKHSFVEALKQLDEFRRAELARLGKGVDSIDQQPAAVRH